MVGIAHHKHKKGEISKKEFKKIVKKGGVGTVGAMAGMFAGSFIGFAAGQIIIPIPIVGGVIGTIVGSVSRTIAGGKLGMAIYDKVENNIRKKRLQVQIAEREAQLQNGGANGVFFNGQNENDDDSSDEEKFISRYTVNAKNMDHQANASLIS